MVLSANTRGHVFLLIVKFIVASLLASNKLSKWVVLKETKKKVFKHSI